ncbi:sucrose phosphorylase [Pseudoalteromonas piscicida]|uniref:sucrose phosphorylase n=1 Tax=Pseudoalteromonas piscicida TaxID=43662 RepID=UPI0032C0CA7A
MKNQVQLITYADRLSGGGLAQLNTLLTGPLAGLFGGVHILPFYYPIDGSDAGFDPIDHAKVDERLGDWQHIKLIAEHCEVMADLIVNHVSGESAEFADVLAHGQKSPFWSMFLKEKDVFPDGITQAQAQAIYRPRPGSCFSKKALASGEVVDFWTTFTDNQIDINVESEAGRAYLEEVLTLFADSGVKIIRLDAAGYAIKRANTSCFMTDEAFAFINQLSKRANELGMETIAEIHSYYKTQVEVASKVDRVYDFALPPLILHSLFNKDFSALAKWLDIAPRNCLTVLDTHDGIGIIDAGPEGDKPGLLDANQIDALVEQIHSNSKGQSRKATGAAASNVDLYQVNCSYYEALGKHDFYYLVARAIQFFCPGVPQVYYGGLLAMENDMALLEKSNVGRDINRPYLDVAMVEAALNKPVVKGLQTLIKLRNTCCAFDGNFALTCQGSDLVITWEGNNAKAELRVDLAKDEAVIKISENAIEQDYNIQSLLS